jgi:hypothetical protein
MRVRVTRTRQGEIDGIELKTFRKGVTYDVPPSLGTYLVTTASADLVADDTPMPEESISEIRFTAAVQTFHDVAAERGRARRKLFDS